MKVLIVFGTRPEAIKMAPIVHELRRHNEIETKVCVTGQHREILDHVLDVFEIVPDYDLNIMKPNQTLDMISASILTGMTGVLNEFKPDYIFVHGDTSTTFIASLAAFYQQIPIAHVEAGLRTHNIYSPWPEEANRQLTSVLTALHLAPTAWAEKNLLLENVDKEKIFVTGNTVIDALFIMLEKLKDHDFSQPIKEQFKYLKSYKNTVLITVHRRENHGQGILNIIQAVSQLVERYKDTAFVLPVHPNPNVKKPLTAHLSKYDNVYLIEPLEYAPFIYLMSQSKFILSDSGGVQEEAPSLKKPVLLLRETTERPEAVEAGVVQLLGTNIEKIVLFCSRLLDDESYYEKLAKAENPYGDGFHPSLFGLL